MSLLKRKLTWRGLQGRGDPVQLKVAVLSTFTADTMAPFLGTALSDMALTASVHIGGFNQVLAECLMSNSATAQLQPDVLVVWSRLEDVWSGVDQPLVDPVASYVELLLGHVEAAIGAAAEWSSTLVFVLPALPELRPLGVGDAGNPLGVTAAGTAAREAARQRLAEVPGVLVADAEEVIRALGSRQALDPRTLIIGRIPYTDQCIADVADRIARLIGLQRNGARKVVVVDADNTLWGGVVGEDGPDGIDLLDSGPGEAFRAFQRWLVELTRAGTLVALASKNNEADVWEGFARREMVLKREHVAAWRINWEPKSDNIQALAHQLNLGLSSFVFIDDNPLEISEVESSHLDLRVLTMPDDPAYWTRLAESGLLDRLVPTAEDLSRNGSYQAEAHRSVVRAQMEPGEFLATLAVAVEVRVAEASDVGRLAQLVAKTNQFTLGGHRHSEPELAALVVRRPRDVLMVHAVDRFGDYGVVGAMVMERGTVATRLDTFVLSCRAMGRGVEDAMLASAVEFADHHDVGVIIHVTDKNIPARQFFARHGVVPGSTALISAMVTWPDHVARITR